MRDYQERTKSCHYYAAGRCLKGDLCTFAHDVSSRPEAQQPWRRASAGQPSVGQSSDGLSSGSPQAWRRSGTIYPETGRVDSQKQNPTWGWKSGGNNKDWKINDIDTPKWRRPSAGYQNDNTTSVDGESRSSDGPSGVWKRSGTSFRDTEIEKPNKKWGWNSGRSATQGWNRGGGNDANSAEGVPPWRRASSGNILRDAEKTETRGRWVRANSPEGYATNDYILPDTDSSDDDDTLSAGGTRLKSQRVGKQIARAGPSNAMPDPTSRERPTTKGPGWSEFSTWRQRLQLNGGAKLNRSQLRPLWEEAIEILKGNDTTLQQKLVEQLLQKGNLGRERIEQHINNDFPGLHYMKDYLHDSFAFIMFATLHELLNSLVMDQHVGTLYVIIFGTDGKQCSEFFERVTNQLAEELDPDSRSSKIWSNELNGKIVTFGRALAAISECLRQVLRRNTRARFQSELEKIVQSLCTIAASVDQQHDEFYPQTRAALREAVGIFRQANAIVDAPEVLPNAEPKVTSTYNIPIDFPGYFSTAGPRHDNDHVRIEDIKILPTLSEILSQRNDFLPRKDPSAPHFFPNGTERLVDTHFRLLRYDYVAQLRDIVSGILRIFGLPEPERKRAFLTASRDNPGCYLYHNTVVECPIFDQRMGLRFRLGFSYPKEIYRMSGEKRQQWWEERKRLERGTLLCLIASSMAAQHICFLMVADKETAPDKKTGLSSGERANILVQPASPELEEDLKFLLAQTQVQPENLVLLEFPKIIPETFVPILANLKELSISGFLPLSQYIAPDGFDAFVTDSPGSVVTEILPPAYARSSGFMFDLSPILNNKTGHYSLSPRADPDDPEILKTLERLSPLDRGQCKALVTGLTQELSLIQGPPGCGKSWLGVRIVQVLLHANYGAAELGPILCV